MNPWRERTIVAQHGTLVDHIEGLYRALRRARDDGTRQRTVESRRYESLARHVAELHIELDRVRRDLESRLSDAESKRLWRISELWRGTDVQIVNPEGQTLTPQLEERVDIIGIRRLGGISQPVIERVDQPIVIVGNQVFRGKVWIARPTDEE